MACSQDRFFETQRRGGRRESWTEGLCALCASAFPTFIRKSYQYAHRLYLLPDVINGAFPLRNISED